MKSQKIYTGSIALMATWMMLGAGLMLGSCSSRTATPPHSDEPQAIEARSSIAGAVKYNDKSQNAGSSRTITTSTQELEGVMFARMDDASASLTVFDFSNSYPSGATREAGSIGKITFNPKQYYDRRAEKTTYLVGYHPQGTFDETAKEVSWPIDAVTDIILSKPWNAGTYLSPKQTPIEFEHALARIEVILQAKAGEDLQGVRWYWGQIDGVRVLDAPMSVKYQYATNTMVDGSIRGEITMVQGTEYSLAKPTVPSDIAANGSRTVYAGAMVAPHASPIVKLKIIREAGTKFDDVDVNLGGALERGKTHRVVLNFTETGRVEITPVMIAPWEETINDNENDNEISPVKPPQP